MKTIIAALICLALTSGRCSAGFLFETEVSYSTYSYTLSYPGRSIVIGDSATTPLDHPDLNFNVGDPSLATAGVTIGSRGNSGLSISGPHAAILDVDTTAYHDFSTYATAPTDSLLLGSVSGDFVIGGHVAPNDVLNYSITFVFDQPNGVNLAFSGSLTGGGDFSIDIPILAPGYLFQGTGYYQWSTFFGKQIEIEHNGSGDSSVNPESFANVAFVGEEPEFPTAPESSSSVLLISGAIVVGVWNRTRFAKYARRLSHVAN